VLTLLRRGAISIGALTLTLGLIAPAMADTYHHRDARHDVGRTRAGVDFNHVPHNWKYDVTRLRVVHTSDQIQFNATLRSTSMKGLDWRTLGFRMETNGHVYSGSWMMHRDAQFFLYDETAQKDLALRCIDAGTKGHTLSLDLDRTCFHNPKWIKVAVSVGGQAKGLAYADNAQSRSWHHPLTEVYSPRIRASE
jgi:hypothetical protein